MFCAFKMRELHFTAALKEELLMSAAGRKKKKITTGGPKRVMFHGHDAVSPDFIDSVTLRVPLSAGLTGANEAL